jgi:DNA polymerase-3 subunit epsilon
VKKKKFAIIDIETTGGLPRRDKITEVAIVLHDGTKILDQYDSLINPERSIPPNITRITGITNDMVADAPKFYEVAKTIVEMTEGTIFVAHNVRFDYSFIREEFSKLGYTYSRRQLCTVKLSRKSFPGLRSYSLGNLIRHFQIQVENRHRALDDALATSILFENIMANEQSVESAMDLINLGVKEAKLPKGLKLEDLHKLPESPGVYYFLNVYDVVVYVGKSINIQKRVFQHFTKMTTKAANLYKMVHSIHFEETGSELLAMLHESKEIKRLLPVINKAQRVKDYPYFVHSFYDHSGYICFEIVKHSKKNEKDKTIIQRYSKIAGARGNLRRCVGEFEICSKLTGVDDSEGSCFRYKIGKCSGACIGEESAEDYNERAKMALDSLSSPFQENMFIITEGRTKGEKSIVLVENGEYQGFGYIESEDFQYGIEELKEAINYEKANPETNRIVQRYLESNLNPEIIRF